MSELTSLMKDTESRNRIVSEIGTNFFVEAGAGSGKTTMLVNRMVAMVEAGKPIDRICAITFTKAAAGEFYDRFQKLLIERSNPDSVWEDRGYAGQLPEPTEETRGRCAEALEKIDLCFMGTIDSFCSMVLSEHPFEAGIPSDASIVSDADAEGFYKQQYVRICAGEYGPELAKLAEAFRAFHRNAEEVFVQGESVIMNNRNVEFHYQRPAVADVDLAFAAERTALIRAVDCLAEHPEIISDSNTASREARELIGDICHTVRKKWSSNLSSVCYYIGKLSGIRVLKAGIDTYGASLSDLFEAGKARDGSLDIVIGKPGGLASKIKDLQYSVSMDFLIACRDVLEGAMREKGNMTFFDDLYYLREMLRKDAEGEGKLIRHIYGRHSYFLIDEFQDTNPMQAEVFFYLCAEHPVPQWSACVPRPGSLFIVGDPKQSIYRFRSADVTSFLKVKRLFENTGGSVLTLSRNFRSIRTLCEYYNRVFPAMLPEETEVQSAFEEIPLPEAREDEFQGIYTYRAYTGYLVNQHPEESDPIRIAKIIAKIVDNDSYLIRTGNDETPRKLCYSDIMVITYGKKKLGPIMALLDYLGIPTRVEGDVPFGANEALLEVFRIYLAVADRDNAIALYGALTGRLIGLKKEEILAFRENGGTVSLKGTFDQDACRDPAALLTAKKIGELRELHYTAGRLSPAALFSKILEDYRVYETAEAENLEVVYYALELLRNAEKSGSIVTLKDGAGYIAEMLDGDSGEERCLSLNDRRDAVHMANLHKVKGLEAPVIILAAATAFMNKAEKRIIHRDNGSEGYLFSLSQREGYATFFETGAYPEAKAAEEQAGNAEGERLVYVAATRARNVLIICDSIAPSFGKEVHRSGWRPIMEKDLPDFFEKEGSALPEAPAEAETVDSAALYEEAEKTCILNDRSVETPTYALENPSRLHLSSKMSEEQETGPAAVSESAPGEKAKAAGQARRFPALLGTMTHKLMEMLVSARNRTDVDSAVEEVIREYRTPSTEPYEKELAEELTGVAKRMRSGGYEQTNGLPQDILGTLLNADEVYCEVPFCYSEDGAEGRILWNGIMDVVYRSNGQWHIVDYKTNADGSDLDRKYRAQLSAYVRAFKETTGEDADALTYHIDI
ncbi:MAG: UvrD-helicase domain-containing protein [Lachnospiraceae bacterium]|nr:UvrD-helicase domain-containing protein [Lachnospiraceae bacterium]